MALQLKFNVDDQATKKTKELQSQLNNLKPSINNAESSFMGLNKSILVAAAGFLTLGKAIDITKNIANVGMKMESMKMSLEAAVGSAKKANEELKFLSKTSRELGLSFEASLSGFTQFSAAAKQTALEGKAVEKIFKGVASASTVMGLSADDQNGVFRALTQIMSKGKVAAEELRGQIGERLPGAFQIAARAMNMTTSELDKFMSDGKLLSEDFLPKFGAQLEKEMGQKAVKAAKTAQAEQARYNNEVLYLQTAINESGLDEFTKDFYQLGSVVLKEATHWLHEWNIQAKELQDIKIDSNLETLNEQLKLSQNELKRLESQEKSFQGMVTDRLGITDILASYGKSEVGLNAEIINQKAIILKVERAIAKAKKESDVADISPYKKAPVELTKEQIQKAKEIQDAQNALDQLSFELYNEYIDKKIGKQDEFDAHVKMFYENQKTLQEQATALMTSDIDKINAKYLEMYDAVQGIFDDEQMQKFFSTWNKEISKATKEQKSYEGIGSDEWTQGLRGQAKDLSNVGKAFKSISKEQEEFNKYSKENNVTEKDKGKHLENQISLFGNLAGAMSNLAEDGSQSAKVLQTAQAALSLTSLALGVAEQSKLPFPYNIAAMASTLATGISILSSLGVSGGGGGGSSSPDYAAIEKQNVENRQTDLENQYEPLLEKFDTQISLLEKIEKNGSASKYSISQARTQYEFDISTYANQIGDVVGGYREVDYSKNNYTAMINTANAFLDFSESIKKFGIDATGIVASLHYAHKTVGYNLSTVLNTKSDLLSYVANRNEIERLYDVARTKISTEVNAPKADIATNAEFEKIKIEVGTFIGDFALAIGDSIEQMKDMSLEFQDIFDSLTNTMTYSNKRLSEAQSEVNALLEGQDFSSYLKNQIDLISEVERKYGMTIDMFLSSDDIALQAQAVIEMERITGIAFDGGAEAALNYLDSINLVAEAMINSNENIKEWNDGFKTNQELAQQMADVLNVSLATSMEELNSLFNKLSTDAEGLTNAELEALEANKSLIEDNQKLIDDAVLNFSNNMKSMADSIDSAINTIKGGMLSGDELTTDQIRRLNYTQMAFESALSGGDSDKARELLSEITSLSTGISSGAFGDTSKINANLVSSLEANKAMIDFTDEVLMVRIVASDLDYEQTVSTTTPSVYVTNSTNNDDRLATLEAIMTEVLKTNKNVYNVLLQIQNDGVKTI